MKEIFKNPQLQKNILLINGFLPILFILHDWYFGNLGANPPEAVIRTTGVIAIIFISLTLTVTPLSQKMKWPWLIKHRRWLGLWAFYYACIHLLAYSVFDKNLKFASIIQDIQKRPFILLGFTAFIFLVPLAVTSTNEMIKKLGAKKWKALHKLTYLIAPLAVVHYWLIVKSDLFYPISFALITGLLLLLRLKVFKFK